MIQALEGLYGYEHKEEYQQRCRKYAEKRKALLDQVQPSIVDQDDFNFLKNNFSRRPLSGLRDALNATFRTLPEAVQTQIDGSEIVAQVRSRCENTKISSAEALTKVRNSLSHGSSAYDPNDLEKICAILHKIVRAEILRVLDLPDVARERMLEARFGREH